MSRFLPSDAALPHCNLTRRQTESGAAQSAVNQDSHLPSVRPPSPFTSPPAFRPTHTNALALDDPPSSSGQPAAAACGTTPPPNDPVLVHQVVHMLCEVWYPPHIPPIFADHAHVKAGAANTTNNDGDAAHSRSTPDNVAHSYSSNVPLAQRRDADYAENVAVSRMYIFVREVLRRSRTSPAVLHAAVCYIQGVRHHIPYILWCEYMYPSTDSAPETVVEPRIIQGHVPETTLSRIYPIASPAAPPGITLQGTPPGDAAAVSSIGMRVARAPPRIRHREHPPLPPLPPLPSPLCCPRRTFVASLILASRFLHEKAYSNRAWGEIVGLHPREVGRCERALLQALDWRLWVGKPPSLLTSSNLSDCATADGFTITPCLAGYCSHLVPPHSPVVDTSSTTYTYIPSPSLSSPFPLSDFLLSVSIVPTPGCDSLYDTDEIASRTGIRIQIDSPPPP